MSSRHVVGGGRCRGYPPHKGGCLRPTADLIAAAVAELQAVGYLPLGLVLGLIIVGVGAYFIAVLRAEEPSAA